jgi:HK97 family phage portal protein
MRILGFEITRKATGTLSPVSNAGNGGWFPWIVREPYTGAWQRNDEICVDSVMQNPTVFACTTLIANDIGKLRFKLEELDRNGIWVETTSPSFSPVLRRQNSYQNHIQFKQQWQTSKLMHGNTVVLKQRDSRNVVIGLYILDWTRVTPLVSPDGSVFYQLGIDNLAGIPSGDVAVPASEIIHDRMNCLFHPLIGLSPIFAAGLPAEQGLAIQRNAHQFFRNGSNPGGVLTAPGAISDATAARLKDYWDNNFTGRQAGKVAVLGDGLKFEKMTANAGESQMLEILGWTDQKICSVFHVPGWKVGVGASPNNNGAEVSEQSYYSQCLQILIEEMEQCLDDGLATPADYSVAVDLDGLLRMDTATLYDTVTKAVNGTVLTPNEGRRKLGYGPVAGGDALYIQQQNYSLEALAKRDAQADPFGTQQAAPAPAEPEPDADEAAAKWYSDFTKALEMELTA